VLIFESGVHHDADGMWDSIAPWMQFLFTGRGVGEGITAKEYIQSRVEVVLGAF